MKKLMTLVLTLILCTILVGCGNEEIKETTNDNNNVNDETKVSTISESYGKYVELKGEAFEKMSDSIPDSDYNSLISLLGFSSIDLIMIPITMCGLTDAEAAYFYSLYTNLDYKSEKDKCTISFKSEDSTNSYVSVYDKNTDSVQTKMYENGKLKVMSEYVKLDKGYGTQQYIVDDDNSTSYRSIFYDDYIAIGFFENVNSEPTSIYKLKNSVTKQWTQGGSNWSEYDNGKIITIPNE